MPTGNNQFLTENDVRIWLRDNDPDANKLIRDYEFSPDEIVAAMTACQDIWNEMPPFVQTMDYTRTPFRYHLLQGTAAQLLYMAANRFRRNALNYSAGGVAFQDQEKAEKYDAAADKLQAQYVAWVKDSKRVLNLDRCCGNV